MSTVRPSQPNERRGATDASYDYGDDYNHGEADDYDDYYERTHYYGDECPGGHLDITEPFDVAAFLNYLASTDGHFDFINYGYDNVDNDNDDDDDNCDDYEEKQ
jgi:hypothetical protein